MSHYRKRPLNKIFSFFISVLFVIFCLSLASADPDKYGGELVVSTTSDPKSFNDIIAKETSTTEITSLMFEGLTKTNAFTLKVEPLLAESWEVTKDGLTWIFHLRQDVQWFD